MNKANWSFVHRIALIDFEVKKHQMIYMISRSFDEKLLGIWYIFKLAKIFKMIY